MEQIRESGLFPGASFHVEISRERSCCNRTEELTKVAVAILGGENNTDYVYYNASSGDLSIIFLSADHYVF